PNGSSLTTMPATGRHEMRTSLATVFGTTLLAVALTAGLAGAQSGTTTDTQKDSSAPSSSPSTQPDKSSQPAQPAQPPAPSQMSPSSGQSSSSTDVRNESRTTERVVETERTKVLGMDPTVATIVGAVPRLIVILAIAAMSRKQTPPTTGARSRRSL